MLNLVTWLLSVAIHIGLAAFFMWPSGGAALQQGAGQDLMVVQQGTAMEDLASLGEDEQTLDEVDADASQESMPIQQTQEIKPEEQTEVIESPEGPEQELETKPVEEIKELPPPQMASVQQDQQIKSLASSGIEAIGGDTTPLSAYIGSVSRHLDKNRVNPRSQDTGTVKVMIKVAADGTLLSKEITKSSGSDKLDKAALASIDKAAPFPPFPADWSRSEFTLTVPYLFKVKK